MEGCEVSGLGELVEPMAVLTGLNMFKLGDERGVVDGLDDPKLIDTNSVNDSICE